MRTGEDYTPRIDQTEAAEHFVGLADQLLDGEAIFQFVGSETGTYVIDYMTLNVEGCPVPLPGAAPLTLLGAAALARWRRRSHSQSDSLRPHCQQMLQSVTSQPGRYDSFRNEAAFSFPPVVSVRGSQSKPPPR